MNCDPDDQKVTLRQVPAGWILGLAMVGLAFAATGLSPRDAERECRWSACATAARAARSIGSTRRRDFTRRPRNNARASRERMDLCRARKTRQLKIAADQSEARRANHVVTFAFSG